LSIHSVYKTAEKSKKILIRKNFTFGKEIVFSVKTFSVSFTSFSPNVSIIDGCLVNWTVSWLICVAKATSASECSRSTVEGKSSPVTTANSSSSATATGSVLLV
jgi:hypothetical protein